MRTQNRRSINRLVFEAVLNFAKYGSYDSVRVFTRMVSCHHEEALNYKLKHKRANKFNSNVDQVAQWLQLVRSI